MPVTSLSINIDRVAIQEAIAFFESLQTKKFHDQTKKHFESHQATAEVLKEGRTIVQQHVYDVYDPIQYRRTRNLYKSVIMETDFSKAEMGSLALLSDPDLAEAKLLPGFSYAAFFIKPKEFKTFIKPRETASAPVNYRPFFILWEHYMENFIPKHARDSVVEAIDDTLPLSMR